MVYNEHLVGSLFHLRTTDAFCVFVVLDIVGPGDHMDLWASKDPHYGPPVARLRRMVALISGRPWSPRRAAAVLRMVGRPPGGIPAWPAATPGSNPDEPGPGAPWGPIGPAP